MIATENDSVESTDDPWCDSTKPYVLKIEDVENAKKFISTPDGIQPTPCIRAKMSDIIGAEIYLKLENFNTTGSFKDRGARYTLLNLSDEQKKKGIVAASMGNHAQGVSYNGMKLGIPITVVMPVGATLMKINKCKRYKANVIIEGHDLAEAKKLAIKMGKETGQLFINSYDHPHVLAGQGTIGLEILDQIGNPDAVICPCGGGGLMSGVCTVIKSKSPSTEIIGVEAEICPSFSKALAAGKPKLEICNQSIADGLAVPKVGYNSVASCLGKVDKMVTVSESLLNVAILSLIEHEKIVTEGGGASPLAALLSGQLSHLKGKKVVLICSGGNIDTTMLGRVLERALVTLGKLIKCSIWTADKANTQAEVLNYVAKLGANVKQIYTERAWIQSNDFSVRVNMMCEVRDIDHAIELRKAMNEKYKKCEFPDFPNVCVAQALGLLRI